MSINLYNNVSGMLKNEILKSASIKFKDTSGTVELENTPGTDRLTFSDSYCYSGSMNKDDAQGKVSDSMQILAHKLGFGIDRDKINMRESEHKCSNPFTANNSHNIIKGDITKPIENAPLFLQDTVKNHQDDISSIKVVTSHGILNYGTEMEIK